ncbi:MAG: spore coat associated protein CotJA [Eubacteriaceae bacterium]
MSPEHDYEYKPMVPFMPEYPKYANAYVPYQINFKIADPVEAMQMGTAFPELYKPYKESDSL